MRIITLKKELLKQLDQLLDEKTKDLDKQHIQQYKQNVAHILNTKLFGAAPDQVDLI